MSNYQKIVLENDIVGPKFQCMSLFQLADMLYAWSRVGQAGLSSRQKLCPSQSFRK